jgi:hypothetical protein
MKETKFVFDLKKGDIDNLNKEEQAEVATALTAFGKSKGFSLFIDYLRNNFVSDAMYENRITITQDYFLGGLDMLDSIETYIAETASYKTDKANN